MLHPRRGAGEWGSKLIYWGTSLGRRKRNHKRVSRYESKCSCKMITNVELKTPQMFKKSRKFIFLYTWLHTLIIFLYKNKSVIIFHKAVLSNKNTVHTPNARHVSNIRFLSGHMSKGQKVKKEEARVILIISFILPNMAKITLLIKLLVSHFTFYSLTGL